MLLKVGHATPSRKIWKRLFSKITCCTVLNVRCNINWPKLWYYSPVICYALLPTCWMEALLRGRQILKNVLVMAQSNTLSTIQAKASLSEASLLQPQGMAKQLTPTGSSAWARTGLLNSGGCSRYSGQCYLTCTHGFPSMLGKKINGLIVEEDCS